MGSIPLLGEWTEQRCLMQWSEGHNWFAEVEIPSSKPFEYKYVIVSDGEPLWEQGHNRTADLSLMKPSQSGVYEFHDTWEHFTLETLVFYPHIEKGQSMLLEVVGQNSVPMTVQSNEELCPSKYGSLVLAYKAEVLLSNSVLTDLKYRFTVVTHNRRISERDPLRNARLTLSRDEPQDNQFEAKGMIVNGTLRVSDAQFNPPFELFRLGHSRVFIGSYPESEDDVITLAQHQVDGVLNFMTV